MWLRKLVLVGLALFVLSGCRTQQHEVQGGPTLIVPTLPKTGVPYPTAITFPTPISSPTPLPVRFWLEDSIPGALAGYWKLPEGAQLVSQPEKANLAWSFTHENTEVSWVFALAAPFPTLTDGVSWKQLQDFWHGQKIGLFGNAPLLISQSTANSLIRLLGKPAAGVMKVLADDKSVLQVAWQEQPSWAIIPFESLEPRWKALKIDGKSPLDKEFQPKAYPLIAHFQLSGEEVAFQALAKANRVATSALQVVTNRDPARLSVVILTGTTAMVRATATRMERYGVNYPGKDIAAWLRAGDITHISNEIAFNPQCPPPDALDPRLVFCSDPKYIGLLESVGANLIDMSGNHINDYGPQWAAYTMDLYRQKGWKYYAAGKNETEASTPLLMEHNGNKIAFLGCNLPGPVHDWATVDRAGTYRCDFPKLIAQIKTVKANGFMPVVTLQYYEYYYPKPNKEQQRDFTILADAGAVIVSGSQAHRPQAFGFSSGNFIHFGLGNLFFDQMETPYTGTRQEFIDRHIFYNGKYIGVELLTAMLEDYARPRPMTLKERQDLLREIFDASGWN